MTDKKKVVVEWIESILEDCNKVLSNHEEFDYRLLITFGSVMGNLRDIKAYLKRDEM